LLKIKIDFTGKSGYILPRMKYQIVIAESAKEEFKKLKAHWRFYLKAAMRTHLQSTPKEVSKSRIKKLRGLRQPQFRLRVDRMRVFYDVNDEKGRVEVLGFVLKPEAEKWLHKHGAEE
jgi:mRNA interferase RelE/StbE